MFFDHQIRFLAVNSMGHVKLATGVVHYSTRWETLDLIDTHKGAVS